MSDEREEQDNVPYEVKFGSLIQMCEEAKARNADMVIVNSPEILGDDYNELVESLNRISKAGLKLFIVPPEERDKFQ